MTWRKRMAEHIDGDTAMLSVVFTWDLPAAYSRAVWLREMGYRVRVGGPAVKLMPDYLADVAECNGMEVDALPWHNPAATFTSRGCVRRCPFCAVPKIEGELVELDSWPVRPVVCDNNLLACSVAHFDKVVDSLKPLSGVDIQGVDARLLTRHHADRLAETDAVLHLAFDHIGAEAPLLAALDKLHRAGFPDDKLRVYVLFGFDDMPEDTLYRMRLIRKVGAWPNPQRYQPLDALTYNSYVGEHWTERELRRFMRYWARSMFFERVGVTFEEYEG